MKSMDLKRTMSSKKSTEAAWKARTKSLNVIWVDSWKQGVMVTKGLKSRCVIQGNQEDTNNLPTYAPAVTKEMIMFITSITCNQQVGHSDSRRGTGILQSRELISLEKRSC